jgi:hypothetical protein
MDHRHLLAALVAMPPALAAVVLDAVEPQWHPFLGQAGTALGTALTLYPAALIAARMLRVLRREQPDDGLIVLDEWLQRIAQEPRKRHYVLLLAGLVLVVAGSIVSAFAAWP